MSIIRSDETGKRIEALLAELRQQAFAEGYEQGKLDANMSKAFDEVSAVVDGGYPNRSAQEERDRIVERAKADVEEFKGENYYDVEILQSIKVCKEETIVNKDKRTVVVLMKGFFTGTVWARGIAKRAPGDCFNLHIGRAIALRRALGVEIPRDYLDAPQPTEARIGDVISVKGVQRQIRVRGAYEQGIHESRKHLGESKIIDDSRSKEVDAS